jgi:hypothetical protein
MAQYGVTNSTIPAGSAQVTLSTTYTPLLAVIASTGGSVQTVANPQALKRSKIYDILIGTNGTPADNFIEWDCARVTASTTGVWLGAVSSVSSSYMLDQADAGFGSLVVMNASAGSSVAAGGMGVPKQEIWYVGVNQRASYRWVAAPGSELVVPANSSGTGFNGVALNARSGAYTGTATGTVLVSEL